MTITIETEEEAWTTLKGLMDGSIVVDDGNKIEFGDWVKATVYIPGKRYDSALSAYMMQGWVDTQRAIYRSYALVEHGEADARRLTEAEREKLELVVKVQSGSSDQEAALMDIIKEVLTGAVDKMDAKTIAIVTIALALIWAGQSVWRSWIENRKEERLAETSSKSMLKALETIQVAVAGDTEKTKLLEKVMKKEPILSELKEEADDARMDLIKHTAHVDAEVNGISLPTAAADSLTKSSRVASEEERRDGVYKILKVDTTVPDGFKVYLEAVDDGETFQANVQEVMSSLNDRKIIQEAEWSKAPVRLQINAKIRRGEVIEAVILRADKYEVEE